MSPTQSDVNNLMPSYEWDINGMRENNLKSERTDIQNLLSTYLVPFYLTFLIP